MALFALSEASEVALINGIVTLALVAISRLLSHREHRRTEGKLDLVIRNGNGHSPTETDGEPPLPPHRTDPD